MSPSGEGALKEEKEETAGVDGYSAANGRKQTAAYPTSEGKRQEWLEEMNERTERQQKAMAEPKIRDLVNWDLTFKNRVAEREFFEESWDDSMAQVTSSLTPLSDAKKSNPEALSLTTSVPGHEAPHRRLGGQRGQRGVVSGC